MSAPGTAGVRPTPVGRDDPAHPEAGYRERARLAAYLAAGHEAHWAEPHPGDPYADAFRVVCVHSPEGQLSWHVHPGDEALFGAGMPTRPSDYDGHSTPEKYARLERLAARAAAGRHGATREFALRLLTEARTDLGRADSRAVGLLGVATTAAAVVGAAVLAGQWSPAQLPAGGRAAWWAGVAAAAAGAFLLFAAACPNRHDGGDGGRVGYYGDVRALARSGTAAVVAALAASAAAEVEVLAAQLVALDRIAGRNHRQIRAGVALVASAGVLLALAAAAGGAA